MGRLLALLAALCAFAAVPAPTQAEPADIAAAARGVVRVVIMATDGDQVYPISHGTGFAVTPTRIVTNAHVVRQAQMDDTLRIAVVPPDGDGASYARIVTVAASKDLALVEITDGLRLPPLTIAGNPASDGDEVAAVGFPMNVDRAQGLDIGDIFKPQQPVKSRGFISGSRPTRDFDTVLHTAPIARGNSGGPLLDSCGRVLGVNSFGAESDGADAEFYFAVSDRELLPFLRDNGISPAVNAMPCRSMAQLDAAERERMAAEQATARAQLAARAEADRTARERAQLEAQLSVMSERENAMALAMVLLLIACGAGIAAYAARNRDDGGKRMRIYGAVAAAATVTALAIWFTRPGLDAIDRKVTEAMNARGDAGESGAGAENAAAAKNGGGQELVCTIEPGRSRIVSQPPEDMAFAWSESGCVNHRTQYGFADGKWSRLFVPNDEDSVSVNSYDPDSRTFRTDRYPLSQSAMAAARAARGKYTAPACGAASAASRLGEMQSGVVSLLTSQPNERLVYSCKPKAGE